MNIMCECCYKNLKQKKKAIWIWWYKIGRYLITKFNLSQECKIDVMLENQLIQFIALRG